MKRFIRLKERKITTFVHTPASSYLEIRPTFDKLKSFYENTDENYFLNNEVAIDSKNIIFLVGDSFIENIYCSTNKRISSVLSKKLSKESIDLKVINAGVSGTTSLNINNLVLNKLVTFKPKFIVVFIPSNDGYCMYLKGGLWNKNKRYSNLLGIDHANIFSEENIEEKILDVCKNYTILKTICDQFNIKLVVSTSPIIDNNISRILKVDKDIHLTISKYRNLVFDHVIKHCKTLKIPTVDLRTNYSNKYDLFFDDVHTNDIGSQEIGNHLYTELIKHFSKFKDESVTLQEYDLNKILILNKNIYWSDSIKNTNKNNKVATLSFDINCSDVKKDNSALFCVDFDGKQYNTPQTLLSVSTLVGSYKYILTKANSQYRICYSFLVPNGVDNIKIGFALWRSEDVIIIRNVKLYLHQFKITK